MIYRLLCLLPTLSEPTGSHTKNKLKWAQKILATYMMSYIGMSQKISSSYVIRCDIFICRIMDTENQLSRYDDVIWMMSYRWCHMDKNGLCHSHLLMWGDTSLDVKRHISSLLYKDIERSKILYNNNYNIILSLL